MNIIDVESAASWTQIAAKMVVVASGGTKPLETLTSRLYPAYSIVTVRSSSTASIRVRPSNLVLSIRLCGA